MTDLRQRFEELDSIPVPPDLWSEAIRRSSRPVLVPELRRSRQVLATAVAFIVVLVLGAVTFLSLSTPSDDAVDQPSTTLTTITSSVTTVTETTVGETTVDTTIPEDSPDAAGLPREASALTEGWTLASVGPTASWERYFDPAARAVYHPDIGFVSIGLRDDGYGSSPGSTVWMSTDGLVWESIESDMTADQLAVGGLGLIATRAECRPPDRTDCHVVMWTSADGRTWTRAALDPSTFQGCEGAARGTCDVEIVLAGGERGLLAAGYDRGAMAEWDGQGEGAVADRLVAWQSADGFTWTRTEIDPEPLGFSLPYVNQVVETPSGWLISVTGLYVRQDGQEGIDSILLLSEDGVDWERLDTADAFVLASVTDIVSGPHGVAAVGTSGQCWDPTAWYSPDGRYWTRIDIVDDGWTCPLWMPELRAIDTDAGYVAGMVDGALWWSPDGLEWQQIEVAELSGNGSWFGQLIAGDPGIVGFVGTDDGADNGVWVWSDANMAGTTSRSVTPPSSICPSPSGWGPNQIDSWDPWMVDLRAAISELVVDTNSLPTAVSTAGDLEPGWHERSPMAEAVASIEADLAAIEGIAADLGWTELEPNYWEPPAPPPPDDPLYWFQELLGNVGRYENEILLDWYETSGNEVAVYLIEGGAHGTPCAGAEGVVRFFAEMALLGS